jgi:hypothetical protein
VADKNTLLSKISEVTTDVDSLVNSILEYVMDKDQLMSEVAEVLLALRDLTGALSLGSSEIEKLLAILMADGEILEVPNSGVAIERRTGSSRVQWNHQALRSAAAERLVDRHLDSKTGTLDCSPVVLIEEALQTTSLSWKLTELRALGLNPDSFSTKKPGKVSFKITSVGAVKTEEKEDNDDDFI